MCQQQFKTLKQNRERVFFRGKTVCFVLMVSLCYWRRNTREHFRLVQFGLCTTPVTNPPKKKKKKLQAQSLTTTLTIDSLGWSSSEIFFTRAFLHWARSIQGEYYYYEKGAERKWPSCSWEWTGGSLLFRRTTHFFMLIKTDSLKFDVFKQAHDKRGRWNLSKMRWFEKNWIDFIWKLCCENANETQRCGGGGAAAL